MFVKEYYRYVAVALCTYSGINNAGYPVNLHAGKFMIGQLIIDTGPAPISIILLDVLTWWWWWWWWWWWGETTSLNCGHQRVYCSSRRCYMRWSTIVKLYRQGKTPVSPTRALWKSYKQSYSSKSRELGEGDDEFSLRIIFAFTLKRSLTCCKILWRGA
jgi:hypothetical protein